MRGEELKKTWPSGKATALPASSSLKCPVFAITMTSFLLANSSACSISSVKSLASGASASNASSGTFGVMTVASATKSRIASMASSSSRRSPEVATITGSRTTTAGLVSRTQLVTACVSSREPNMPIFTASMVTSSVTAASCSTRKSTGGVWTARTPTVF